MKGTLLGSAIIFKESKMVKRNIKSKLFRQAHVGHVVDAVTGAFQLYSQGRIGWGVVYFIVHNMIVIRDEKYLLQAFVIESI